MYASENGHIRKVTGIKLTRTSQVLFNFSHETPHRLRFTTVQKNISRSLRQANQFPFLAGYSSAVPLTGCLAAPVLKLRLGDHVCLPLFGNDVERQCD